MKITETDAIKKAINNFETELSHLQNKIHNLEKFHSHAKTRMQTALTLINQTLQTTQNDAKESS
jgi:hypothetical protein